MSAKAMLIAMVAGTAAVLWAGSRAPEPEHARPAPQRPLERPWLTHAASAQIVAADGSPGPLFAGLELGGPAPTPEVHRRIAAFARANDVRIDLEIVDGVLAAIRFDVTFGGCCGYEGVDTLAMKFGRQSTGRCCVCGPDTWINDWSVAVPGGVTVRARVRVNRLSARWEKTVTLPELVDRADHLLGLETSAAREAAGDRWAELELDRRYFVEVAYPIDRDGEWYRLAPQNRGELGVQVVNERAHITQVSIGLRDLDEETMIGLRAALRTRWGRPQIHEETWTWRTKREVISAELNVDRAVITIRQRT